MESFQIAPPKPVLTFFPISNNRLISTLRACKSGASSNKQQQEMSSKFMSRTKSQVVHLSDVLSLVKAALWNSPRINHAFYEELLAVLESIHENLHGRPLLAHDEAMSDSLDVLESVLHYSNNLPCDIVFQLHSCIGLLNLNLGHSASAHASFIKALWIAQASSHLHAFAPMQSFQSLDISCLLCGEHDPLFSSKNAAANCKAHQAQSKGKFSDRVQSFLRSFLD